MASEQEVSNNDAIGAPQKPLIPNCKYSKRVVLKTLFGRPDGGLGLVGERIVIGGWVKSSKEVRKQPQISPDQSEPQTQPEGAKRDQDLTCNEILQCRVPLFWSFMKIFGLKEDFNSTTGQQVAFDMVLQVNDGSCTANIQVVVDSSVAHSGHNMLSGTSVLVEGVIEKTSSPEKHILELKADKIIHLGALEDHEKYPLTKKRIPLHSLRDWAHFRPRTTTVASVMRIRDGLNQATHNFFHNNEFLYVQVPIVTTTDTDGFSYKFHVTTLLNKMMIEESSSSSKFDGVSLESIKASLVEKKNRIEELKRSNSNKEAVIIATEDLAKTNELVSHLEGKEKGQSNVIIKSNKPSFLDDYFSCQAFLTVSGRLHLESYACALGNVYSFGPRFKAETLQSTKRVSEMWMVEAEMAFAELEEAMNCATDLLKHLCKSVIENCSKDMKFVQKRVDQSIVTRLQSIVSTDFEKISYSKAIDVLKQVKEKKFNLNIEFGIPLTEELESYLANEIYKKPVVIYDYPQEVKPFYVRQNADGKTVAAFDVIVPKVGALIRGSQNEERVKILTTRIKELGLSREEYSWYMDLRQHGTVKHAGFSLNFDLMVLLATGITDVRDVIPFPRSFRRAKY